MFYGYELIAEGTVSVVGETAIEKRCTRARRAIRIKGYNNNHKLDFSVANGDDIRARSAFPRAHVANSDEHTTCTQNLGLRDNAETERRRIAADLILLVAF